MEKSQIQKNVEAGSSSCSSTYCSSAAVRSGTFCKRAQLTKCVAGPTFGEPWSRRCMHIEMPFGAAFMMAVWLLYLGVDYRNASNNNKME